MRIRKGLACVNGTAEERKSQPPKFPSLLPVLQHAGEKKNKLHSGGSFLKTQQQNVCSCVDKKAEPHRKSFVCKKKTTPRTASVKSSV